MSKYCKESYDPIIPKIRDDVPVVEKALSDYIQEAEKRRYDAGMNCNKMLLQAQAFVYGWNRESPPFLEKIINKLIKEGDPEWEEYQRLKEKFGDA